MISPHIPATSPTKSEDSQHQRREKILRLSALPRLLVPRLRELHLATVAACRNGKPDSRAWEPELPAPSTDFTRSVLALEILCRNVEGLIVLNVPGDVRKQATRGITTSNINR